MPSKSSAKTNKTDSDLNYAELNQRLEEILYQMEAGSLDIDQALEAYQEGLGIITDMEKYLKTAQNTVTKLKAELASQSTGSSASGKLGKSKEA